MLYPGLGGEPYQLLVDMLEHLALMNLPPTAQMSVFRHVDLGAILGNVESTAALQALSDEFRSAAIVA